MDKTEELLAVLNLPEEQHIVKLLDLGAITSDEYDAVESGRIKADMLLADLAFRLRDEVSKTQYWQEAKYRVGNKVFGGYHEYKQDHESTWDEEAQPIHWIIAVLIAKGWANRRETKWK